MELLNLSPTVLTSYMIVLLISFPIHEFAHAWTANYFGDDTPRINGRLTLNPLAHLDLIGSVVLLVAGFGWAKPVPVNPYVLSRRSPAAMMWVSLAGPASNLLLALLVAIPLRIVSNSGFITQNPNFLFTLYEILYIFIYINLLLMLFNLIPLAPLDGEKIASYFLPESWSGVWDTIRPFGPFLLMALVFLGVVGDILHPTLEMLVNLLLGWG